jgi:hypothetical protein
MLIPLLPSQSGHNRVANEQAHQDQKILQLMGHNAPCRNSAPHYLERSIPRQRGRWHVRILNLDPGYKLLTAGLHYCDGYHTRVFCDVGHSGGRVDRKKGPRWWENNHRGVVEELGARCAEMAPSSTHGEGFNPPAPAQWYGGTSSTRPL